MDLVHELARRGFTVQKFDEWHYRVNGEFDFWFNAKGRSITWWDRIADQRGRKPEDQLLLFIVRRLTDPPAVEVPHEEFVRRLTGFGWTHRDAEEAWQKRQSVSA